MTSLLEKQSKFYIYLILTQISNILKAQMLIVENQSAAELMMVSLKEKKMPLQNMVIQIVMLLVLF